MAVNGTALVAVLLNWAWLVYRRRKGGSASADGGPGNSRLANLLFLWAANAAGAAEFVLVNSFLGPPSASMLSDDDPVYFDDNGDYVYDDDGNPMVNLDPLVRRRTRIALVYVYILMAYVGFVVTVSMFSMSCAPLRVAEDVWLLGLAAFACYTVYLDHTYYKEGQYLLVDHVGAARSCKSRFLDYFPLDDLCRTVVATCAEHAPDTMRMGEEPPTWVGRLVTYAVIIAFKAVELWYEHRMRTL